MYDPSMRVLTVLEILQAREQIRAAELASIMEVSVRTVQRYVARLQDLGIPVVATRGPGATYRLRAGHRLPPLMFNAEEAFLVSLGLQALRLLNLQDLGASTAGVQSKLERVLPASIHQRVKETLPALEFDLNPPTGAISVSMLTGLANAVRHHHPILLHHQSRKASEPTLRKVDPLGLLQKEGHWFLAGHCHLREDLRLFRVDRIQHMVVLPEAFEGHENFELQPFVQEVLAFGAQGWTFDVTVHLPFEQVTSRLPRAHMLMEPQGPETRLRGSIPDLKSLAAMLLYLGCEVTVHAPLELMQAFEQLASRSKHLAGSAFDAPNGS